MREARTLKLDTCDLKCLALRLVDCHGKGQMDWELPPLELQRHVTWNDWDAWNEHVFALSTASQDHGFDDVIQELLHAKPGAITKLWCVEIAQKHDWRAS